MKLILSLAAALTLTLAALQARHGACGVGDAAGHEKHACVETALLSYLDVQAALAGNDLAAAQETARELATTPANAAKRTR